MKSATRIFNSQVPNDFDVNLIDFFKGGALFAKKRKMIWHFVKEYSNSSENDVDDLDDKKILQRHVPRFSICERINFLRNLSISETKPSLDKQNAGDTNPETSIYLTSNNNYGMILNDHPHDFDKGFSKLLNKDMAIYETACAKVEFSNGLYVLPQAESYTNKPVASKSKRLIEAISFERESTGKLDATKFGIYSAFCTWKDFIEGKPKSRSFYEDHVDGQLSYDADQGSYGTFMDIAMAVQNRMLEKPMWGKSIQCDRDEAVSMIQRAMDKLSSIQMAQFTLMNGMHSAGLFFPLAQILKISSYEYYADRQTQDFWPNSHEEQSRRADISFIQLLGDLGDEID